MRLYSFSDSEYLVTAEFYIGHTLFFFGHVSTFLYAYSLDTLLVNI